MLIFDELKKRERKRDIPRAKGSEMKG